MSYANKIIAGGAALVALTGCMGPGGYSAGQSNGTSDELACVRAVTERAATNDVTVISYETSEANNLVMLGDGYGATWRCLVNDGRVVELSAS